MGTTTSLSPGYGTRRYMSLTTECFHTTMAFLFASFVFVFAELRQVVPMHSVRSLRQGCPHSSSSATRLWSSSADQNGVAICFLSQTSFGKERLYLESMATTNAHWSDNFETITYKGANKVQTNSDFKRKRICKKKHWIILEINGCSKE